MDKKIVIEQELRVERLMNTMRNLCEAKSARKKKWVCRYNKDTCDFCKELHGKQVKVGDKFHIKGYDLSGPPAHKGCRCYLQFVK